MTDQPIEVNLDDLLAEIATDLGDDATTDEAAAVAAAVGAHLRDRERAAAAQATGEEPATVSPWTFNARLAKTSRRGRWGTDAVERGDEWRTATRLL